MCHCTSEKTCSDATSSAGVTCSRSPLGSTSSTAEHEGQPPANVQSASWSFHSEWELRSWNPGASLSRRRAYKFQRSSESGHADDSSVSHGWMALAYHAKGAIRSPIHVSWCRWQLIPQRFGSPSTASIGSCRPVKEGNGTICAKWHIYNKEKTLRRMFMRFPVMPCATRPGKAMNFRRLTKWDRNPRPPPTGAA